MSNFDCCQSGHLHKGTPRGNEETINGIRTYVSKGAASSRRALLQITDVFGMDLINHKLVADVYAQDGKMDVYVPDFLKGDPIHPDAMTDPSKKISLPDWLKNHGREESEQLALDFVKHLKSQGYEKIAVTGYCWGAPGCYALSREEMVDAATVAHPSFTEIPKDIEGISTPFLFLCAEEDARFTSSDRSEAQKIAKDKSGLDIQMEVYSGVSHGFAVRGAPDDQVQKEAASKAAQRAIAFFQTHL